MKSSIVNYIIVDPLLVYLPQIDEATEKQIDRFVKDLRDWSSFAKTSKNVQFRLSRECRNALLDSSGYPWGESHLSKLLQHSGQYRNAEKEILSVTGPFLNNIYRDPFIDEDIAKYKHESKDWQVNTSQIDYVEPSLFITRQPTDAIRDAYTLTLLNLSCTRSPEFAEQTNILQDLWIASPVLTIPDAEDEANCTLVSSTLSVQANVIFICLSGEEFDEKSVSLITEFIIAHSSETIHITQIELEIETVQEALAAAIAQRSEILIEFPLTRETAEDSDYEDPVEIFNLLIGLADTWLEVYKAKGPQEANRVYYEKFQRRCKSDDSDLYPEDYTVNHNGENYFCGRHVVLGTGINCARINFYALKESGDNYKILLARVGTHGRNKRRHS